MLVAEGTNVHLPYTIRLYSTPGGDLLWLRDSHLLVNLQSDQITAITADLCTNPELQRTLVLWKYKHSTLLATCRETPHQEWESTRRQTVSAYYVNLSFRKVAERQCCGKEGRDLTHCWTLIYIESAIELLYWDSVICTVEQIPAVKSNCLSLLTIASLICAKPLHTPQNCNSLQFPTNLSLCSTVWITARGWDSHHRFRPPWRGNVPIAATPWQVRLLPLRIYLRAGMPHACFWRHGTGYNCLCVLKRLFIFAPVIKK